MEHQTGIYPDENGGDRNALIAAAAALLRGECREMAIKLTSDDCVNLQAAARLIDRTPKTLTNWRTDSCSLPIRRRIIGRSVGGRIYYTLTEIAEWRVRNTEP